MTKNANFRQEFRDRIRSRISASRKWYDIRNADSDVAEIRIYDEISFWGITAEDFARELDAITAPEILVMINSPGGDVFDGVAIYNALRAHPAKVTTRVDGLAASAASFIAQAGDHRIILSSGQMMIHDAWGLVIGDARDMREMADLLDRQSENIANIYAARSGKDKEHFRALMAEETWFNDEESVENGLVDEVVDPSKTKDSVAAVPPAKRTLSDEITEAADAVTATIESAQRVAALRAEKGKGLSQVNRDSLDGLNRATEELKALLNPEDAGASVDAEAEPGAGEDSPETPDEASAGEGGDDSIHEAAEHEFLRFAAL